MPRKPAVKKSAAELRKEKLRRIQNSKKSGHQQRSRRAKQAAKKMSKSQRRMRALKAAKTRRKLYGPSGRVNKPSK